MSLVCLIAGLRAGTVGAARADAFTTLAGTRWPDYFFWN